MAKQFLEKKALSHLACTKLNDQEYSRLIYLASQVRVASSAFVRQAIRHYIAQFPAFSEKAS